MLRQIWWQPFYSTTVEDSGEPNSLPAVFINEGDSVSVAIDATRQLTVTLLGEPEPSLAWASDDEEVATVSNTGLVTGIGEGSCTVTVTATNTEGEDSDTITINVTEDAEMEWGFYSEFFRNKRLRRWKAWKPKDREV